ncbi:hypothetical protein HELRODRAFT_176043 [Helobdella robusta]|uniref:Uncharacterized protein n=1 Tax=Helobdella robusta TaxID=6412 RepID=T1FA27_HELRO|nr:hypothetical protein HELRODRAFT_176043 [Helobdella robusta]ESO00206.1 hypothetical protein HELRODRAFT_176043 [Helobdella robusta]
MIGETKAEAKELLNNYYGSIFTHEKEEKIPVAKYNSNWNIFGKEFRITETEVVFELGQLKKDKSPGINEFFRVIRVYQVLSSYLSYIELYESYELNESIEFIEITELYRVISNYTSFMELYKLNESIDFIKFIELYE